MVSAAALTLVLGTPEIKAQAVSARVYSINIPAKPLPKAIADLSAQTGLQVLYTGNQAFQHDSHAVSGRLAPEQALRQMLQGTGLNYHFVRPNAVTLDVSGQTSTAAAAVPGAISLDTIDVQGAASSDPGRTEGTGSYTTDQSSFGKNQTLKELPQTVSVITHQRIQDQRLTTVENALEQAPGITVRQDTTATSSFFSRGFQITNYQIDGNSTLYGAGLYNDSLNTSGLDLAMFDRVEVLRGSDALYGISGEPGGTINLVRKKPTRQFQMNSLVQGGSWSNYRGELDVGGPVTENGSVRARLVGVYEDRKYFYDHSNSNKYLLYGIVEADVTDSTMLTFGADYMRQDQRGYMSWGLPRYSNGADLGLPRNFYFGGPDDRFMRNNDKQFIRIDQELGTRWKLGVEALRAKSEGIRRNLGWFGPVDPITLRGPEGYDQDFDYSETQTSLDVVLKGSFDLFGREHKLTLGTNINKRELPSVSRVRSFNHPSPNIFEFDIADYASNEPFLLDSDYNRTIQQKGLYGSLVFQVADPLKLIAGGRLSWYKYNDIQRIYDQSTGAITSTSSTTYEDNKVLTPYLGVVYDLSKQWSVYASAADTYKSQANYLTGPLPGTPLGPITGRTYEVGVKGSLLNGRVNTTLALYHINRNGEAVRDSAYPPTPGNLGSNCCYLDDGRILSRGVDIEVGGEIVNGWRIQAGYTFNENENKADGGRYSTITPKHLFKLWTSYDFQGPLEGLKVGGGVTAQSSHYVKGVAATWSPDTRAFDGPPIPFEFTEPGRAVVDLFVQYRFDKHWSVALNVNNVFDKKYYMSASTTERLNWYGTPRNFMLSARAQF